MNHPLSLAPIPPTKGKAKFKAVKRTIVSFYQPSLYVPQHSIRICPKTALTCEIFTHQYIAVKYDNEIIWVFIDALDPSLKKQEISASIHLKHFELESIIFLVLKKDEPSLSTRLSIQIISYNCPSNELHHSHSFSNACIATKPRTIERSALREFTQVTNHQKQNPILSSLEESLLLQHIKTMIYGWIFQKGFDYLIPLRLVDGTLSQVCFKVVDLHALESNLPSPTHFGKIQEKSVKSAKFDYYHNPNSTISIIQNENMQSSLQDTTTNTVIIDMHQNNELKTWIRNVNEHFPGYEKIVKEIIETIELSSRSFYKLNSFHKVNSLRNTSPQSLEHSGLTQIQMNTALSHLISRGIIISGPSGVGKSTVSRLISRFAPKSWKILYVNATYIFGGDIGQSEKNINDEFQRAVSLSENGKYSVILILDQLESIGLEKSMLQSSRIEKLVTAQLMHCMRSLQSAPGYISVVGLTTDSAFIDSTLREVGLFDNEFEFTVPSQEGRKRILTHLLTKEKHSLPIEYIKEIVLSTHGMIAADLKKLIEEAKYKASQSNEDTPIHACKLTIEDLNFAIENCQPSLLIGRELRFKSVNLTDMAGIDSILEQIQISVIDPMANRSKFTNLGITPPKGILLTGPSGVGKTTLAAAIANAVKANFISVQCPDILSKVVGSSSRAIASLFKQARSCAPCVLFFDQFEAVARSRSSTSSGHFADQMLSTLLIEMDGVYGLDHTESPVLVLAASNRVDLLDPAVLRPGRMDQHIRIELPDVDARLEILKKKSSQMPLDDSVDLLYIAHSTDGYSGAQLENICREAAMLALRENIDARIVTQEHFIEALSISFKSKIWKSNSRRQRLRTFNKSH